MARTNTGRRIVLHLDPRIALDEVILNRLERLPATRRKEWLRGLLGQGLLGECQAVCRDQKNEAFQPVAAFRNCNTGEVRTPVRLTERERPVREQAPAAVITTNKPFAALGKVIG